jgi:hypothetical protein
MGLISATLAPEVPMWFWWIACSQSGRGPVDPPQVETGATVDSTLPHTAAGHSGLAPPAAESGCSDGQDDDRDGLVDCDDPDCEAAPECTLGCLDAVLTAEVPATGSFSSLPAAPGGLQCGVGNLMSWTFVAPSTGPWVFADRGGASSLAVVGRRCEYALACGESTLALSLEAGQPVGIAAVGTGDYDLLAVPVGPEVCDDGVDNDLNNAADCLELTCGLTEPACAEPCTEAVATLDVPVTVSLLGHANNLGGCTDLGADVGIEFQAPVDGNYVFDLDSGPVSVFDGCGGAELACGSDPELRLAAGQVVVVAAQGVAAFPEATLTVTDIVHFEDCGAVPPGDADEDGVVGCADRDCLLAPACVEDCANGTDDDLDGFIDCDELACAGDPACAPQCREAAEGPNSGDTTGLTSGVNLRCFFDDSGPDEWWSFTAPTDGDWVFHVDGADDFRMYEADDCDGPTTFCDLDTYLVLPLTAGELATVVVDGDGPYELLVYPFGAGEPRCDDGLDDDADGATDCADGDCVTFPGCAEECDGAVDEDLDGRFDCADSDCALEPRCQFGDCPGGTLQIGANDVSTIGEPDMYLPSCGVPYPDVALEFVPPVDGHYFIGALGDDAPRLAIALYDTCGPTATELACTDWTDPLDVVLTGGVPVVVVVESTTTGGQGAAFQVSIAGGTTTELDCADHVDEDVDGRTDCADVDCDGVAECAGACPDGGDLVVGVSSPSLSIEPYSEYDLSCWSPYHDTTWRFVAPNDGSFRFTVGPAYLSLHLALLDGCSGAELSCSQFFTTTATRYLTAGEEVIAVVRGDYHEILVEQL